MPIYQCYCPEGLLTQSTREKIVAEIGRIHCDNTGAPPSFVNVQFLDLPEGRHFAAGRPSSHSVVFGNIRAGRSVETRHAMLREYSEMWTRLTGQTETEVLIALFEVPAEDTIEAGLILPNPGDEKEWFATNHDRLAALGWVKP
jgi:phenylpyruvate tautomerase PptA (4-oxalocrotonate tautomerase family)